MTSEDFKTLLNNTFSDAQIELSGEACSLSLQIVSPDFNGMGTLKRHKAVYALVNDEIKSGEIHALAIKAYTPDEWAAK